MGHLYFVWTWATFDWSGSGSCLVSRVTWLYKWVDRLICYSCRLTLSQWVAQPTGTTTQGIQVQVSTETTCQTDVFNYKEVLLWISIFGTGLKGRAATNRDDKTGQPRSNHFWSCPPFAHNPIDPLATDLSMTYVEWCGITVGCITVFWLPGSTR